MEVRIVGYGTGLTDSVLYRNESTRLSLNRALAKGFSSKSGLSRAPKSDGKHLRNKFS